MRFWTLTSLLCASSAVGLVACGKRESSDVGTSSAQAAPSSTAQQDGPALSAEQREAVARLSSGVHPEHWTFPPLEVARKGSAPVLEHIALTTSEPSLAAATLHALNQTAHRRGLSTVAADPATRAGLEKYLPSAQPVVAFRALVFARLVLRSAAAPPDIVQWVVGLGPRYPRGAGRLAVLVALSELTPKLRTPAVTALEVASLADEAPFVVSQALANLGRSADSIEDRAGVMLRAVELMRHADPGVRGRALALASVIQPAGAALPQPWLDALVDESAYVRAQAALALGRLGNPSAIHHLVTLVGDAESTLYTLAGFRTLDGAPGKIKHRVSNASSVGDAVIAAIVELAKSRADLSPLPGRDGASASDPATDVKTWYQRNRAAIGAVQGKLPPKVNKESQPGVPARHDVHAH